MREIVFDIIEGVISVNGNVVSLPYPVSEAITVGGLVIVRIEPAIGEIFNTNIYGIRPNGDCAWMIEESPHGTEGDKPFTSIFVSSDGQLIAGNWNGVDYIVSTDNGTISPFSFSK